MSGGKSLHRLQSMANDSRKRVFHSSYNGAAGAILMDQKKYEDAIARRERIRTNPFTMNLLVQAYYPDREAARSRSQTSWHQPADDGASFSGSGRSLQAPEYLDPILKRGAF